MGNVKKFQVYGNMWIDEYDVRVVIHSERYRPLSDITTCSFRKKIGHWRSICRELGGPEMDLHMWYSTKID